MTRELPRFARDLLASCPTAGQGVNVWLFRTARVLHPFYPDKAELARLLESACIGCGREVSRIEIERAVANSQSCAWRPGEAPAQNHPVSKWPDVNQEHRAAIIRDGGGLADLWELSRPRFEDNEPHTGEIIDALFPGNPLLCCGKSNREFDTRSREEWRGELSGLSLIVPSPMTVRTGKTQDGRESKHSLSNTGPRRFLVCEFDGGTLDEQAAIILHLATRGPLVLALHSGGKSLHGWFRAAGVDERKLLTFFRYAVSLGADSATWTRSQFVRMPDGLRDNGKKQTLFFSKSRISGGHEMSDAAIAAEYLEEASEPLPEPTAQKDPWFEHASDAANIVIEQLPPVIQIVEGIVAEHSKLVICSSAKCFKTWLTIAMGLAISHGVEFLERETARRRVLYVNLELKPLTFKRRVQAIAKALELAIEPEWFMHLPLRGRMAGVNVADLVTRLIRQAQHFKAEVVILDPVFKANTEGEENNTRDQTIFFNELDRFTTEGNATLILNDHSTKGNQSEKDPLDVIRGSSAKGGDVDAAMILRKHEVDGCYRVDMVHRELAPVEPFSIGWNYPLMELRTDLDPEQMKKAKGGRKRVYDPKTLLAAIGHATVENPVSIAAWASAAGLKRPTLYEYLSGMRVKGWIATTGEGGSARQYVTDKGRKILTETAGEL